MWRGIAALLLSCSGVIVGCGGGTSGRTSTDALDEHGGTAGVDGGVATDGSSAGGASGGAGGATDAGAPTDAASGPYVISISARSCVMLHDEGYFNVEFRFDRLMDKAATEAAFSSPQFTASQVRFNWVDGPEYYLFVTPLDQSFEHVAGTSVDTPAKEYTFSISTAARDTKGNALIQPASVTVKASRMLTLPAYTDPDQTGYCDGDGAFTEAATIKAGDTAANAVQRGVLTFDVTGAYPFNAYLQRADLHIYLSGHTGDPLASLGNASLAWRGAVWNQNTVDLGVLVDSYTTGWRTIEVTDPVSASSPDWIELRVIYDGTTDMNGTADTLEFPATDATLKPYILMTVEAC